MKVHCEAVLQAVGYSWFFVVERSFSHQPKSAGPGVNACAEVPFGRISGIPRRCIRHRTASE